MLLERRYVLIAMSDNHNHATCTTERYTAELDAETYIERFRRADYFLKLCQQCGNYGRRYGCPPFDHDPLTVLQRYGRVQIIGVKVTPHDKTLPLSAAGDMMHPVTTALNEELLELERSSGGMSFSFVGSCPYCDGAPCARIEGEPCRHPDKVRPSLEAYGFDVSLTAKELLGIEIKWSEQGLLPEYLTLIGGVFY